MADLVTQAALEALVTATGAKARATQGAVEALAEIPTGGNRATQAAAEVLLTPPTRVDLDPAGEVDQAQTLDYGLASAHAVTVDPAGELDQAQPLTWRWGYRLEPATEVDQALRILPGVSIEPATEVDEALQLTYGQPAVLLSDAYLEVTHAAADVDGQLTLAYLEVLTVRGHNLRVWWRF